MFISYEVRTLNNEGNVYEARLYDQVATKHGQKAIQLASYHVDQYRTPKGALEAADYAKRELEQNTLLSEEEQTAVARLRQNGYWIADWWSVEDVHQAASNINASLTDDKAKIVLKLVHMKRDANEGINWSVLEFWINDFISDPQTI